MVGAECVPFSKTGGRDCLIILIFDNIPFPSRVWNLLTQEVRVSRREVVTSKLES